MADTNEMKLGSAKEARGEEPEKYPVVVRIFGVASIIAGLLQVNAFILALVVVLFGHIDLSQLEEQTATTIAIDALSLALSFVLAVLFIILGIRLLRGKRRRVALMCIVMMHKETNQ